MQKLTKRYQFYFLSLKMSGTTCTLPALCLMVRSFKCLNYLVPRIWWGLLNSEVDNGGFAQPQMTDRGGVRLMNAEMCHDQIYYQEE